MFLTDALSNTIQVVDRNSGLREGQFLIASLTNHQLMGFGSGLRLHRHGDPARPQLRPAHAAPFDTESGSFEDAIIETGGTPTLLFTSPDGRRAYVVHPLEGRVDILRLECDPDGSCETLASTLDVDAFPYQVEFDSTGRYAFVIHLFSNDVTVVE